MATETAIPTTTTDIADVIRRHLKKTLPCALSREEMTTIAIDAAKKRRRLRELESDLAAEKKRRQQQIDELQGEIDTHDRELDTGEQDRVVLCDEIFRSGTVYVRRSDTLEEIEPRPATAQEAQRYLPAVESTLNPGPRGPLLDQAAAVQAAERAGDAESDDDDEDEEDDDVTEDDGLADLTPAQKAASEAAAARKARRGGRKGKGK